MKIPSMISLSFVLADAAFAAPVTYRYRTTGKSGYAYFYNENSCGDWPFTNSGSLHAFETSYKEQGKGKPSTHAEPYVNAWFELWSDCTAMTATLTMPDWSNSIESPEVSFPGVKLASGSVQALVPAMSCLCTLVEVEWDGYPWSYYECDYDVCTSSTVDASVSWAATGQKYRSSSSYRSQYSGGFSVYRSKGFLRDANVSMTFKIDGTNYGGTSDGYLEQSTSSEFSRYEN